MPRQRKGPDECQAFSERGRRDTPNTTSPAVNKNSPTMAAAPAVLLPVAGRVGGFGASDATLGAIVDVVVGNGTCEPTKVVAVTTVVVAGSVVVTASVGIGPYSSVVGGASVGIGPYSSVVVGD
jgi:hypothetical protein